MHAEELWTSPEFKARAARAMLTPASWLYAAGWQTYLSVYTLGLKKPKEAHTAVICIGNLQVGGTGKTPVTVHVTDVLRDMGRQVVISCSGYGSPASEAARMAPDGPISAREWGDEAALIRWLLPAIPLVIGRNRVRAAELVHALHPGFTMLMDDGFQHLPLKKHVSIVLDPDVPNRRCLPAGPYREPWGNRARADLVIPGEFKVEAQEVSFTDSSGRSRPLDGTVSVLCALGRPAAFLDSLGQARVQIDKVELRPDHDPLAAGNLLSAFAKGSTIVVTGKDWVKLRERQDIGTYDFAIATRNVHIEPRDRFQKWLETKLNGIPTKEI